MIALKKPHDAIVNTNIESQRFFRLTEVIFISCDLLMFIYCAL